MYKLNVKPNKELDLLISKAKYIQSMDESIDWVPTSKGCFHEFRTSKAMDQEEAINLLNKIKTLEQAENYAAYKVMPSRSEPGVWRIIVNLEAIEMEHGSFQLRSN